MNKNSKNQKEELARRLAEEEEKKEQENLIRANAYYLNFNAPQAGYYTLSTRIASR